jgi:uncharacterized membrane protein
MKFNRTAILSALFLLIAVGAALWLYPSLPLRVPTHWGLDGQVNGYHSRFWAAAFPAVMIALLAMLAFVLPAISPRHFRIGPFASVWHLAMLIVQGLVLVIGLAVLLHGAGYAVNVPVVAMLGAGMVFMVIGNYMGKLRRNFFIGVRTPWTLASDVVWERTHRLAGQLMMLAGLLVVAGSVLGVPVGYLTAVLVGSALAPCLYSLLVYWRLERF